MERMTLNNLNNLLAASKKKSGSKTIIIKKEKEIINIDNIYDLLGKRNTDTIFYTYNGRKIKSVSDEIIKKETLLELEKVTAGSKPTIIRDQYIILRLCDIKGRENAKLARHAYKNQCLRKELRERIERIETHEPKTIQSNEYKPTPESFIMSQHNSNIKAKIELGENENAPIKGERYMFEHNNNIITILGNIETYYQEEDASIIPLNIVIFRGSSGKLYSTTLENFHDKHKKIEEITKYAYLYIINGVSIVTSNENIYFEDDESFLKYLKQEGIVPDYYQRIENISKIVEDIK